MAATAILTPRSPVLITPPSPTGLTVRSSPVAGISRTGLVSPESTLRFSPLSGSPPPTIAPPMIRPPSGTIIGPPSPRTVARTGLTPLQPTSPVIRPFYTTATPPSISGVVRPATPISGGQPVLQVSPPRTVGRPIISPASAVSPGPLQRMPGFVTPSIGVPSPVPATAEMKEEMIESLLADRGYTVTQKIFVQTPTGITPKFAKAKNSLGQTVLVDLNQNGNVVYQADDRTMIVSREASLVPESKQIGLLECAKLGGTCGIAYDCQGEICTLKPSVDDPSRPTTIVLNEVRPPEEARSATIEGIPTAYPIVNLSDILSNPRETAASVERAEGAIRRASEAECYRNVEELKRELMKLNGTIDKFLRYRRGAVQGLNMDLTELGSYRATYVARGQNSGREQEKFERTAKNIDYRQQELLRLYGICEEIPVLTKTLKDETAKFEEGIKFIETKYDFSNPMRPSLRNPIIE